MSSDNHDNPDQRIYDAIPMMWTLDHRGPKWRRQWDLSTLSTAQFLRHYIEETKRCCSPSHWVPWWACPRVWKFFCKNGI